MLNLGFILFVWSLTTALTLDLYYLQVEVANCIALKGKDIASGEVLTHKTYVSGPATSITILRIFFCWLDVCLRIEVNIRVGL